MSCLDGPSSSNGPVPAEIRQAPPAQATVLLTGHQPSKRRAVLVHAG